MGSLILLFAAHVALAQQAGPQLTRAPELVTFVEAALPEGAQGLTGTVVLALTLAADGTVEDAVVSESGGEILDAAAVAAARGFVFTPAEVDGKPSRIRILYRYDFVERVAPPTTAIFAGVVIDREAKVPLAGVTVTLADGRSTITDEAGNFLFEDVPPGTTAVTLSAERLTPLSTEEALVAGERLDARYEVFLNEEGEAGDDMEILVSAPTIKRQAVSTEIPAEQARKVPGTSGDVLKVVENMPGVARASLGTGAIVVWGAAPADTGVYVDGVPVPRLYHDGGLRSVVGSELVRTVGLVPGGYGASHGRGLGGLVTVDTRPLADAHHGAVSADLYDAAFGVSGPMGPVLSYAANARVGWVGPLLSAFYPDVEDVFPIPHYWDAQARVGARLPAGGALDVTALASSDQTARTAVSPDPTRTASEAAEEAFQRVSVRYTRDFGDGTQVTAVVFAGADQAAERSTYGTLSTDIVTETTLGGARAAWQARVTPWLSAEAGVDALARSVTVSRTGSIAVPPREGDLSVFGQPPPDQVTADSFAVALVNVAPYAEAQLSFLDGRVELTPGLRLDPYVRSVSRAAPQVGTSPTNGLYAHDLSVEPRLSVRVRPVERVTLTAAAGLYGQQPSAADLSAAFGNPTLPAANATHVVLGAAVRPLDPLSLEITGFWTGSSELAMRSTEEEPARAEALVATGEGRSYGAQALLRLEPWKNAFGWLGYTLSWSERRETADADWRPSDHDQRHVLTALGGYTLPFAIDTSARVRVATGYPRTEVVGAYYDARRDLFEPLFGAHNADRLPTFFQLDLRVARSFSIRSTALELSLEVQNVTNTANVEEFVYNADYSERGAITGLPVLPVLGARWSY